MGGDTCERCGRDLTKLGGYRDYPHYILGTGVPCLESYSVEANRIIAEEAFEKVKVSREFE